MLDAINFVKGAIIKNSALAESSHFHIGNGRIIATNGVITMSSPIPLNLIASPEAIKFEQAIKLCEDTISMHITKANRLVVRSGDFKAHIDCATIGLPYLAPEGEEVSIDGDFLSAIKKVLPFVAKDNTRPWARGVLFNGQSIFATNNTCLIEHWLPFNFPVSVNVPVEALVELLRIGIEPKRLRVTDNSITFLFDDDRWLKTILYGSNWPDLSGILSAYSEQKQIPDGFFDKIKELSPFVDNEYRQLFVQDAALMTSKEIELGASFQIKNFSGSGIFNADMLLLLKDVATTIDLHADGTPCLFFGDNIRGAIMGMKS